MIDYAQKQYATNTPKPTLLKRILQWLRRHYYTEITHAAWEREWSKDHESRADAIIKTIESLDKLSLSERQDAAIQAMMGKRLLDGKAWSSFPTVLRKKS